MIGFLFVKDNEIDRLRIFSEVIITKIIILGSDKIVNLRDIVVTPKTLNTRLLVKKFMFKIIIFDGKMYF